MWMIMFSPPCNTQFVKVNGENVLFRKPAACILLEKVTMPERLLPSQLHELVLHENKQIGDLKPSLLGTEGPALLPVFKTKWFDPKAQMALDHTLSLQHIICPWHFETAREGQGFQLPWIETQPNGRKGRGSPGQENLTDASQSGVLFSMDTAKGTREKGAWARGRGEDILALKDKSLCRILHTRLKK